jgi:hypothetical protein
MGLSTTKRFESVEFEEPIVIDGKYRIRAIRHGRRLTFEVERLDPPLVIRKETVDKRGGSSEDKSDSTS